MFQSPQAITIAIFYFIMFLIIAFISFTNLPFLASLKVLTPYLVMTILLIYDTDCLVSGGCFVYSWIRSVLYLIVIITAISIFMLSLFSASKVGTTATAATAATASQPATTATTTTTTTTPATTATTTTTPATTTTTPTTAETTGTTPATSTATTTTASATPVPTTTEKFASWEAFSDVQDQEDFTQMF
jgi:hypothetical protein